LAVQIRRGKTEARDKLIEANLALVVEIVPDFKDRGVPDEDLIQEGNLALLKAVQNFHPTDDSARFSTYATIWIRAYMARAVFAQASLVRLPRHTRRMHARVRRARDARSDRFETENDQIAPAQLDANEVGGSLGFSPDQMRRLEKSELVGVSLEDLAEEPIAGDLPGDEMLIAKEDRGFFREALARLSPFEIWVLRERFGLDTAKWQLLCEIPPRPHAPRSRQRVWINRRPRRRRANSSSAAFYVQSHEAIAKRCGLTRQRVSSIEKEALAKLREYLAPRFADDTD
jgi:RNA polymerase sigma factor (sigma-70 family)